ncbi:MAG: NADH-quinone oxidoreductase subunit NuoH [Desulfobacula sp.]|nr:NADH-quinone oxidoreductase subunit NuoH [Desulfobacula sp.]
MKENANLLFVFLFKTPIEGSGYSLAWYILFVFIIAGALLFFAANFAGITSFIERRIAARIQTRVGPNVVGPQGILQWVADGIKLLLKEDLIPDRADQFLFRVAPYFVFSGLFAAFVALPFGYGIVAADLNVGVYYIFAITSLVVVGIIMGGWSSNSKWALFGALRSAAQIISYEIPTALSLIPVIMLTGSLSTQDIIKAQGGLPWDWFVFHSPFTFVCFVVFFISALAEGNRIPFDLPEAESELVSGYNTEYSGFRFLVFPMAEWANLWVIAAMVSLTYLGGWQVPFVSIETLSGSLVLIFLSVAVFVIKTSIVVFIVMQLRWTLPRVRVDQMTQLCWTYLVPFCLVAIVGTMIWMLIFPWETRVALLLRLMMFGIGFAFCFFYVRRIRFNYFNDKTAYENLKKKSPWYPIWRLP